MAAHNYEWFRRCYGVPARRNAPVVFDGRPGKVTATSGPYLRIKFDDGAKSSGNYHPTWKMEWLEKFSEFAPRS